MTPDLSILRNAALTGDQVAHLRAAVGWDARPGPCARALAHAYAHWSAWEGGELVAYVSAISDGVGDAFLVDLMVHPDRQRRGVGRALVRRAVADLTADGIQCVQAVFIPELEPFYRACGFHILRAGMIDNRLDA